MKAVKSLRVDTELWKKAKIYCAENDITLSEFIENLLREKLEKC